MKKIYLLLFVVILGMSAFAQKALRYDLSMTQGFVLCNFEGFPDVYTWNLQVFDRVYKSYNDYSQKEVFSTKLVDVNYFRLDDKFFNSESTNYFLVVTGFNKDGEQLVSEEQVISYAPDPDGNEWFHNKYEFYCVSDNYAWQVNASMRMNNGEVTNSGYLSLDDYIYDEDDPYSFYDKYVYFTISDIENYCQNYSSYFNEYYNVVCDNFIGMQYTPINVIKLTDIDVNDNLHGPYGNIVSGDIVYGIKKTRGPWQHNFIIVPEISPIYSDWNINYVADFMNLHADPGFEYYEMDELECIQMDPTVNGDPPDMEPYEEYEDCFEEMNGANWNGDDDFFDIIQAIDDCINGIEDPMWPWWPSFVDYVSVSNLSSPKEHDILIYRDSLIDINNNIITAPSFTLNKGLYLKSAEDIQKNILRG